jgi:LacI family transcriptional regulator
MPTTLKDIAEQSGYSVTTVSRALTGYDDVNETTRTHILTIAQQLGYQPNHVARQLQKQRTLTLGLVLPHLEHSLEDDFFQPITQRHYICRRGTRL